MRLGEIEKYDAVNRIVITTAVQNTARMRHTYVNGASLVGKSTALQRWAIADIKRGRGLAFFDPDGNSVETILKHIPTQRLDDVVLIDFNDRDFPVRLNFLADIHPELWEDMTAALTDALKTVWADSWGVSLDRFVYNCIAALIETGGTLLDISPMLSNKDFRAKVIAGIKDKEIHSYWTEEFLTMPDKLRDERIQSVLNKIGRLRSSSLIRNCIGQKDTIDLKDILDSRKIVLIKFPPGRTRVKLLGSLLLARFHIAAQQRTTRSQFHIYVDNAKLFGPQLVDMLTDLPKHYISMVLASPYISALDDEVRDAVMGSVGRIVAFRCSEEDATTLKSRFAFERDDTPLEQLPAFKAYTNSEEPIDGKRTTALMNMPMTNATVHSKAPSKIRHRCRVNYARPRKVVEAMLN